MLNNIHVVSILRANSLIIIIIIIRFVKRLNVKRLPWRYPFTH